jgi:O-antigen/teichoic acid export membrane protein
MPGHGAIQDGALQHELSSSLGVGQATVVASPPDLVLVESVDQRWTVIRLLSVSSKAGLAVLGQALFAGSHFLVNVFLARWLSPEQYGAFALAFACFLLFSMLYSACIYEPMIVFGSSRYADGFKGYLSLLVRSNLVMLAAVSVSMLAVSFLLGRLYSASVQHAFAALALAAPFVLLTWLGRGGFYARLRPGGAAVAGAFYFCILIGVLVVLRERNQLSPVTAFLGMGLAGLVSAMFLLVRLGFHWRRTPDGLTLRAVTADHWRYGKWAVASALVAWFPDNIYYAVLPAMSGLEGSAALRALINLINPVLHTVAALSAVLIPTLVRHRDRSGIVGMTRTMRTLLALLVPASLGYAVLLLWFRSPLFQMLYNGNYRQYSGVPVLLVGAIPIAVGAVMVLGAGLRAVERPDCIFWAYVVASLSTLCIGLPLSRKLGVVGAAAGMLISSCVAALSLAWLYYRRAQDMSC